MRREPELVWHDDCWWPVDALLAMEEAEHGFPTEAEVKAEIAEEWMLFTEADELVPLREEDDGPEFAAAIDPLSAQERAVWDALAVGELAGAPAQRRLPPKRSPVLAPVRQRGRSRAPRRRFVRSGSRLTR